jgi:hypothetical protein
MRIFSNSVGIQCGYLPMKARPGTALTKLLAFDLAFSVHTHFDTVYVPGIVSIKKSSVCHCGVVLMKTEYMNQEHRRRTTMQHTTTSTIITTVKQIGYFETHYD